MNAAVLRESSIHSLFAYLIFSTTPDWGMRREVMSKSYTAKLDQLWGICCRQG